MLPALAEECSSPFDPLIIHRDGLPISTVYRKEDPMAISISDSATAQPVASPSTPDLASKPTGDSEDSVKLSQDAQIQLLAQQGRSPSEIAQNLGIAAITVAAYLGEVPVPSPAAPEPQSGPSPAASIPAMS